MSNAASKRLGDLINLKRGYDLPENQRRPGPYPVISSAGITGYHDEYMVEGTGVVTGRYGTLGEMYYVDGKYWPHNTALYVTTFKGNDPKYIYYLLTCLGRIRTSDKSAVPGVNRNELHEMAIPVVTDKNQQQRIAAVLSALDAKIDSNNRINAELEAMAKTLYDYWFVQFDFPDANGKPYKSSGGKMVYNATLKREIPAGWRAGLASDLFDFNPSLSLPLGTEASYIDMAALPVTGFMTEAPECKAFAGGMKFQNGDVVVARITPCLENGKTALISLLKDNEVGFGSTEFIVIRGKSKTLSAFAAQLSRSTSFRQFAISNMTGTSGRKRIDANTLETFSMPLPQEEILLKYEQMVSACFKRMTINAKENQQLAQLRDWLLPLLMNGQVTVA
ncbi:restriction endonuclease subunit S [Azoarcus sp. CIB]|uniref:restriction endonuclease subunit S n=1 Tax=Aromatoleum sp. (strain CIB) TaxID=198107 RepID=UPI00067B75C3|nr:restriction endonuclease subunit S [Azoarcus sp. CIB]